MDIKIKTALISVSDKSNLEKIVQFLKEHKVKIISTGGTAKSIADLGIEVTDVASITNFPEMMDGRVLKLYTQMCMVDYCLKETIKVMSNHKRTMGLKISI